MIMYKKKIIQAFSLIMLLILSSGLSSCGNDQMTHQVSDSARTDQNEVHVAVNGSDKSGKGTPDKPFASASHAAEAAPGSLIIMHRGDYGPIEFGPECSGNENSLTSVIAAEGEKVKIHAEDGVGIHLVNTGYISIEGLETEGGTHGVKYTSTRKSGNQPLQGIKIKNCTVHGVRGVHGICVYAENDLVPVKDLTIEDCEVYDCECGSSESLVLNGNIDGFLIEGNSVHDNNNIGIDMIGFEGTAEHKDKKTPVIRMMQILSGMGSAGIILSITSVRKGILNILKMESMIPVQMESMSTEDRT